MDIIDFGSYVYIFCGHILFRVTNYVGLSLAGKGGDAYMTLVLYLKITLFYIVVQMNMVESGSASGHRRPAQ